MPFTLYRFVEARLVVHLALSTDFTSLVRGINIGRHQVGNVTVEVKYDKTIARGAITTPQSFSGVDWYAMFQVSSFRYVPA